MDLIAHRGFAGRHPENTVRAVRAAADRADWVEVDVRRCGSGESVVVHDATVDRVTDAAGPVREFDAADLAALSVLGTEEGVPTLSAVLDAVPPEVGVNVELKEPVYDALDPLEARERESGRVLVSAFDSAVLREVGERSNLDRAYLAREGTPLATAADLDCAAVHPHHSLVDAEFVECAHDRGLAVNAWTVADRATAGRLREAGVDGVIADDPDVP